MQDWCAALGEATAPSSCAATRSDWGQEKAADFAMPEAVIRVMVENQAGFVSAVASENGKPCAKFASALGVGLGRNSLVRTRAAAVGLRRECV